MIFEQQNQKKFLEFFFSEKKLGNIQFVKKILKKEIFFGKKILKKNCQLQVTIPSTHPVQISSRSDYSITLL